MRKIDSILITGASGLLGGTLVDAFCSKYSIVGLCLSHPVSITGARIKTGNILSPELLNSIFNDVHPDVVIHCASLTNVDNCEKNPYETREVNVIGTRNVVDASISVGAKLIYISTDSVYKGDNGNYCESDQTAPQNVYGKTKLQGETEALKGIDPLVIRTNIFGWNIVDKKSLGEWVLSNLREGKIVKGFTDAIFSSIYTYELGKIIERTFLRNLTGIFNCGSRDSCSKFEFAKKIASRFGFNSELITPISIESSGLKAKRGKDLSLDVGLIERSIDCIMPTVDFCIEQFYRDYRSGYPEKFKRLRNLK